MANRAKVGDMQVNVHDAKSNLSKLLQLVEDGEDVVIARAGTPIARLVPYDEEPAPKVAFGLLKGQVWEAPDAWDPDPELEAIYARWEQEDL